MSWLRRGEHCRKRGRRSVAELTEILKLELPTCGRAQKDGWHYVTSPLGRRYMCWHGTFHVASIEPQTSTRVVLTPPEALVSLPTLDAS
jgi:hypothetical protein